jgi:hypothetical protein
LRNVTLDPSLLNRMVAAQAFDRRDVPTGERSDRSDARTSWLAINVHSAGPALSNAAAELCAGEP